MEKYSRAGQATTHAHRMLDTKGYKHTLTIYNTYCSSTATTVERKRLRFTLYVHCLSVILLCTCVCIYEHYVKYDLQFSLRLRIILSSGQQCRVIWWLLSRIRRITLQHTAGHLQKLLQLRRTRWPALSRHASGRPSMKHKYPKKTRHKM